MVGDITVDLNAAGWVGSGLLAGLVLFIIWKGLRLRVDVHHHRDREEPDDRGV